MRRVVVDTDGAGNRGRPCGIGVILTDYDTKSVVCEESLAIGPSTNNIAEYCAVTCGLERALEMGYTHVLVKSDSQIVVNQVNGSYEVRKPHLLPFYTAVRELAARFVYFRIEYVKRPDGDATDLLAKAGKTAAALYRSPLTDEAVDAYAAGLG